MDVVVLSKLRPATSEILLAVTIIPHFHLIWDATTRLFTENCLSQLVAIHKLREIQRQALNLTALRHGDAKERKDPGRCGRSSWNSKGRSD
jgi:hypothetical protein